MRGRDHLAVGVATAALGLWGLKAVGAPIEVGTIGLSAVSAGLGALMPDLDHPDSKASNALPLELLVGGLSFGAMALVLARLVDRLAGDQSTAAAHAAFAPLLRGALFAVVLALVLLGLSLALRAVSNHRGITHSLVFAAGVTLLGSIGCAVFSLPVLYGVAFGWGWLTHLVTDAMTPAGLPSLLWPFDSSQMSAVRAPSRPSTAVPAAIPPARSSTPHEHDLVAGTQESLRPNAVPDTPLCPHCGIPMVLRTARRGSRLGQQFYGCANFPRCRQVSEIG